MVLSKTAFDDSSAHQFEKERRRLSFASYLTQKVSAVTGIEESSLESWYNTGKSGVGFAINSGAVTAAAGSIATWGGAYGVAIGTALEVAALVYKNTIDVSHIGRIGITYEAGQWVAIEQRTTTSGDSPDNSTGELKKDGQEPYEPFDKFLMNPFNLFSRRRMTAGSEMVRDITIVFILEIVRFGTCTECLILGL